jgi:hypothetical protein
MTPMSEPRRLTVVTGLFDLARREANPARRQPEEYVAAAEFLFGLDVDLVAFADWPFDAAIHAGRARHALASRTLVVPTTLEAMPTHELLSDIAAARASRPLLNGNPDKDTPLYVVLQWAKLAMLRRALMLDPFDATHAAWIDIGIAGVVLIDPSDLIARVFTEPTERVRLLMRRSFTPLDVADPDRYYASLWGHVAAGYMVGARRAVQDLCDAFEEEAQNALSAGVAPSEEQLLPVLAVREPDLFEFHYGDYSHILLNYDELRGSAANLLFQLRHCRERGETGRGLDIGRRVAESIVAGAFEASAEEREELLAECALAGVPGAVVERT